MRVRLKPSSADSHPGWLTPGRSYVVLEVIHSPHCDGEVGYRIESDDARTPAIFDAGDFLIVDAAVSPSRVVIREDGGSAEAGFWESFFDGDPTARSLYDAEIEKLHSVPNSPDDPPPPG